MKNAIPAATTDGINRHFDSYLPVVLFYVVTVAPEELIDALVIRGYFETLG